MATIDTEASILDWRGLPVVEQIANPDPRAGGTLEQPWTVGSFLAMLLATIVPVPPATQVEQIRAQALSRLLQNSASLALTAEDTALILRALDASQHAPWIKVGLRLVLDSASIPPTDRDILTAPWPAR